MSDEKKTALSGTPCDDCRVHDTLCLRVDYVESDHEDLRESHNEGKRVIWQSINKLNDEKVSFRNFKMFMSLIVALLLLGAGLIVETRVAVVKELSEIRKELNGKIETTKAIEGKEIKLKPGE